MPIYEYECDLCRCNFEKKQRFYDEAEAACPECQGKARRILHAVPSIFKGSGFYITDSRKSNTKEKGKEETPGKENKKASSIDEGTSTASH